MSQEDIDDPMDGSTDNVEIQLNHADAALDQNDFEKPPGITNTGTYPPFRSLVSLFIRIERLKTGSKTTSFQTKDNWIKSYIEVSTIILELL